MSADDAHSPVGSAEAEAEAESSSYAEAESEPAVMTLEELSGAQTVLAGNMDAFFLIIIGIIIFFMQGGFAFLEAGSVR